MPKGCLLAIGLAASLLAFLYSLAGIAMAYWVAALPDQTPEHIRLNFLFWVFATLLTLALSFWFAVRLFTGGKAGQAEKRDKAEKRGGKAGQVRLVSSE